MRLPVVASNIGHGAPGLRTGLRTFADLIRDPQHETRATAELGLGRVVPGVWTQDGATYYAAFLEIFDGIPLDAIGVETLTEGLTRVETQAKCDQIPGTYYYEIESANATAAWDSGVAWDSGLLWDSAGSLKLYVHLTGDADPNETLVVAILGFYVGTVGIVEPSLGPEKLIDGEVELYTASNNLVRWTEDMTGSGTLAQYSADPIAGTYSALLSISGGGPETWATITQASLDGVAGAMYRYSGAYRVTSADIPNGLFPGIRVGVGGGVYLDTDGMSTSSDPYRIHIVDGLVGETRRFLFDFVCPTNTSSLEVGVVAHHLAGTGDLAVLFDSLSLRRIWRFNYHRPILSRDGLPALRWGFQNLYFGVQRVAGGRARLLNSNDELLELLATTYDVPGRPLTVYYGGAYTDGQEITQEDMIAGFSGVVREAPDLNDEALELQVEDLQTLFTELLPRTNFDRSIFSGLSDFDDGRPRAFLLGRKGNIRAARISLDGSTSLPTYEVSDPSYQVGAADALKDVHFVYAYTDEDAANRQDTTRRVTLVGGAVDWSADLFAGRVSILRNPGVFEIVAGVNDVLDLTVDGASRAVKLTPGLYTSATLAAHVESKLDALPDADFTFAYANSGGSAHKFSITYAGSTLTLPLATGNQRRRSAWPTLGFDSDTDKTGSLSYTADTAVYDATKADTLVIRIEATGAKDDAVGTFTGSPNAAIAKGPDVVRFLLARMFRVPLARFGPSFDNARSGTPDMGIYLGALASIQGSSGVRVQLGEVFTRISNSNLARVVFAPDGMIHWVPQPRGNSGTNDLTVGADVVEDRNLVAMPRMRLRADDVLRIVRVNYDQDPSTARVRTRETTNADTGIRFGRAQDRTFDTWLTSEADAAACAEELARIGRRPVWELHARVAAVLVRRKVTDLFRYERDRGVVAWPDQLQPNAWQILEMDVSPDAQVVDVVATAALLMDD